MTKARRSFVIAFTGAVLWVVQAAAQAYPSRPITIIVPSAAGGLSDAFVRLIGDTIQGAWGQPVVMDPRSGAGGIIGAELAGQKNVREKFRDAEMFQDHSQAAVEI